MKMGVPFYSNVPAWMTRFLATKTCDKCGGPLSRKNVIAVGIREYKNETSPFVEYACPNCSYRAVSGFGQQKGSLREMCLMLLENMQNQQRLQTATRTESVYTTSKMTDKEVKDFLRKLRKSESYEDVLKEIGATAFQVDLNKEKPKPNES